MKKILSFAVIVLCISTIVRAQDIVNLRMDRQQMGLRGPVSQMDEDQLLRKDYFREDWPQRKWFVKDLRNVLREEEGRIVTFNPAGRMVTVTYTYQGKIGRKTACSYASNGLLTSFSGEGYKIEARYKGNTADINVFAETKDYSSKVDIARANLKGAAFNYSYPFDLKCRQELGDDGLLLRSTYYYVDSTIARDCEYNYNHNNLLTSEKTVDFEGGEKSVSMTRYTYDNKDFLVKKVVNSKAVDATFTYENNEQGDCIKMTVERPYGTTVYTFEYLYDDHDNWTVRLEYEDGIFDNATVRSFTYHKESADKKKASAGSKNDKKAKPSVASKKDSKGDAVDKQAAKEAKAAEKVAKKEAEARQKEAARTEKAAKKEAEKNMTKEQRKAAQAAEKEKAAREKAAEKERKSLERAAAKEKAAAEKERKAAEKEAEKLAKEAEKEAKAATKAAEKERKAAAKEAEKERKTAEKQAAKERKAAEKKR